jgi:NhaA family Na+:H+ antiporter
LISVAVLGGIGFTMSLFIGELAFGEGEALHAAKLGILIASLVAGVVGATLIYRTAGRTGSI